MSKVGEPEAGVAQPALDLAVDEVELDLRGPPHAVDEREHARPVRRLEVGQHGLDQQVGDLVAGAQRLAAALDGVVELGAAQPGDKTMVDALEPAVRTLARELDAGKPAAEALASAHAAAEEGMQSTVPLQARKGRASYLGERSIGHQDPGATSTVVILRALELAVAADQ